MLKFRLKYATTAWIDTTDPNEFGLIRWDGNETMVEVIRDRLMNQYGAFGHLIYDSTTPIDLAAAMRSPAMAEFDPELMEGAELVERYDPGIPDGAMT